MLGLSVAALVAAALRVASLLAPAGMERGLSAVPLAVAAAVAETLLLGFAGLGGSSVALTVAALLTWGVIRAFIRAPGVPLTRELASWWRVRSAAERAMLGALGGAAATWAAWQLIHPQVGFDSEVYHLPEIVLWVQGGHPGAVENVLPGLPVGNYPLTDEVTVAWATGIARSFIPFMLWPWLALGLTATAAWAGLRTFHIPLVARALATAALCTSPWLLAWESHGTMTDPAALAWLVCGAALFALAQNRPVLCAPALLALGLSVGVKTTTVPLALLVVALGLTGIRRSLREIRLPVIVAVAAAIGVGGVWYLRNLIEHGSPFWPVVATPWGDPVPNFIELFKTSFIARPGPTIDRLGETGYLSRFGGGLLLLAGALFVPAICRHRRALAASAATAVGLLIWVNSPLTGVSRLAINDESVFSTTRYLLPVMAAAALALAFAAAPSRRVSVLPTVILLAVTVTDVVQTFGLNFPNAPAVRSPSTGAVAGVVLATAIRSVPLPNVVRAPVGAAAAAALGALLAFPAQGFLTRYGVAQLKRPSRTVINRLASDRLFNADRSVVAGSPGVVGTLAGDQLRHHLRRIPPGQSCEQIAERVQNQWLIVYKGSLLGGSPPLAIRRCLPNLLPTLDDASYTIYAPRRLSSGGATPGR
jgi:hypothetical protein